MQAPAPTSDFGKIGGAILAFIILQAIYAFTMIAGFPGAIEDLFRGMLQMGGQFSSDTSIYSSRYTSASENNIFTSIIAVATLILYSIIIIMTLIQLITRNSGFLRNFQLAGIVAIVGNLIVFVIKEYFHITDLLNGNTSYSIFSNMDYHWSLVMLALLWTIFWTLYFVRSSRMMYFMSPSNPYSPERGIPYVEKALFGKTVHK